MNYKDRMEQQRLSDEQRSRIGSGIEAAAVSAGADSAGAGPEEDSSLREVPGRGKGFAALAAGLAAVVLVVASLSRLLPVILQQGGNEATLPLEYEGLPIRYTEASYAINVNDPRELMWDSDACVIASVLTRSDGGSGDPAGALPYTNYTVRVEESYKGSIAAGSEILLRKSGGLSVDADAYELYRGDFLPEVGGTYIFFIYEQADGSLLVSGQNSNLLLLEGRTSSDHAGLADGLTREELRDALADQHGPETGETLTETSGLTSETESPPAVSIVAAENVTVLNSGYYVMRQNGKAWSWLRLEPGRLSARMTADSQAIGSDYQAVDDVITAVDLDTAPSWRVLAPFMLRLENPPDHPYVPADRLWTYSYEPGFDPDTEQQIQEADFAAGLTIEEPMTYRGNAGTVDEAYFTLWPDGRFKMDRNIAVNWIPEGVYELETDRLILSVTDGSQYIFSREADGTVVLLQSRDTLIGEGTVFRAEQGVPEIFRDAADTPAELIVPGTYRKVTGQIEDELRLTLFADGTFTLSRSPISSVFGTGRYEVRASGDSASGSAPEVVLITDYSPLAYAAVFTVQDGSLLCTEVGDASFSGALMSGDTLEGSPAASTQERERIVVAPYPYTAGLPILDYSQIEDDGDAGSIADLSSRVEQLVLVRYDSQQSSLDADGRVVTKSAVSALETLTPEYALPDEIYSYGGIIEQGALWPDLTGSAAAERVQITYAGIGTPQPGAVALVALRQEADGSWWLCRHEYAASLLLTPWTADHHDLTADELTAVNNSYGNPRQYRLSWLTEQLLPERDGTEATGYIDSGLQRPYIFYNGRLWEQSADENLQPGFEEAFQGVEREMTFVGKTVAEDHKDWPDEELEAARILIGTEVYYDSKNDVVYIHEGDRMTGFVPYIPE